MRRPVCICILLGTLTTMVSMDLATPVVVDTSAAQSSVASSDDCRLWTHAPGEGHSAISLHGTHLYTLYRPLVPGTHAEIEIVAALDAQSGKTVWEYSFVSPTAGAQFWAVRRTAFNSARHRRSGLRRFESQTS